ncbi:MAG: hypothetical protein RIM84_04865 [Alphaproteobacteria bacterium]
MRAVWISLLLVVGLAACQSSPPPATYPQITYLNKQPIALDVARIDVVVAYQPPLKAPNVEHRLPVSLSDTIARWATDRLRAVGSSGTATFTVLDASVIEQELETRKGLTGLINTDQAARLKGRVAARLEIDQGGGLATGFAEANASRIQTIAEGITLAERDDVFYRFEEAMAKDLDRELEAVVREKLGAFVR